MLKKCYLPFLLLVSTQSVGGTASTLDLKSMSDKIINNEYQQMTGVVVAKEGNLVFEQYFNGGGPQVKNDMRSASKSLTSMAVGLAIDDGLISGVDQVVLPYFKDKFPLLNPDPRKSNMVIEDLLTMSSLLECDDWNHASRGNEERMYLIEDWSRFILNLPIKGTPPWKKTPAESPYGRAFSYCTGGVQVLTDIVERVTKQPMVEYLQKKIFNPLKIEQPVFSFTPLGTTNGGGGARLTARDWIKIGQLMMQEGRHNGQQLLSKSWVKESFKIRAEIDSERRTNYGYLWWINEFTVGGQTVKAYAAAGNGGNYLFMLPDFNVQVVITSQAYNTSYMHQQSQAILTEHVIPALLP